MIAARTSTMTHRYPPPLDGASVVVTAVTSMAWPVLLAGQGAARRMAYHLGFVSALLGPVHRTRESGRHSPGVRHRVDPPCLLSAGGACHGGTRLRERTLLLERSAILAQKLVSWHWISYPFRRCPASFRCDFNHGRRLARGPALLGYVARA